MHRSKVVGADNEYKAKIEKAKTPTATRSVAGINFFCMYTLKNLKK